MRHKSPSELNSKTIRISLGDYTLLDSISRQAHISFAEALHLLITEQARQRVTAVPHAQIPMPTFSIKPAGTFRIKPQPTLAVNGNKVGILVINAKGGVISE